MLRTLQKVFHMNCFYFGSNWNLLQCLIYLVNLLYADILTVFVSVCFSFTEVNFIMKKQNSVYIPYPHSLLCLCQPAVRGIAIYSLLLLLFYWYFAPWSIKTGSQEIRVLNVWRNRLYHFSTTNTNCILQKFIK